MKWINAYNINKRNTTGINKTFKNNIRKYFTAMKQYLKRHKKQPLTRIKQKMKHAFTTINNAKKQVSFSIPAERKGNTMLQQHQLENIMFDKPSTKGSLGCSFGAIYATISQKVRHN